MKGFVDKVKAGNWGKTLMAVANLGAAATSVGVSAGVAAAQPLAKDLARGFEDFTVKGLQSAKPVEVRTGRVLVGRFLFRRGVNVQSAVD